MENCLRIASHCLTGFFKKVINRDERGNSGCKSSHLKANLKQLIYSVNRIIKVF